MAARVKNTASADDFKRAALPKVPELDPAQYMHLCTEKIATSYLEFMLYVLEEVTPRPTAICDVAKEARLFEKSKFFKTGAKLEPNMTRNCLALQDQGVGLEPSKSSTTLLPVTEGPKRKLKEVVSVPSSEDTFVSMKPQSCSASAMLEALPGKASFTASSSKAASKVVVEQQELPSAPASKVDGSDKIFLDKGQGVLQKIIQALTKLFQLSCSLVQIFLPLPSWKPSFPILPGKKIRSARA